MAENNRKYLSDVIDYDQDTPLDSETQESIKDYLFSIGICTSIGTKYSNLGSALKDYGFTCRDQSHRKGCRKIISKNNGGIF